MARAGNVAPKEPGAGREPRPRPAAAGVQPARYPQGLQNPVVLVVRLGTAVNVERVRAALEYDGHNHRDNHAKHEEHGKSGARLE